MLFLFEPLMQSEADLATIQLKLTLLLGSTTIVYLFCRNNIFPPEFMLLLHYSIYTCMCEREKLQVCNYIFGRRMQAALQSHSPLPTTAPHQGG